MPKAFRFAQSGRSMVEMLGTLAVMGVLSIGGIMGYSYAVDKYHSNQIMNDVNLRGIDLIAQASRGGDFSLDEWPTKTSSDLDIGLEVDEATNTTEGGIYVNGVEKDICEIIADDLLPEKVELVIDGETYTSGKCGETNKMVFYYDAVAEALGGGNQNCIETENGCMSCPAGATISADKTTCECPNGKTWNSTTNECVQLSCKEAMIEAGFYESYLSEDGTTITYRGSEATISKALDISGCNLEFASDCNLEIAAPLKVNTITCLDQLYVYGNPEELSVNQITAAEGCYNLTLAAIKLSDSKISGTSTDLRYIKLLYSTFDNVTIETIEAEYTIKNGTFNNVTIKQKENDKKVLVENMTLKESHFEMDSYVTVNNSTIEDSTITAKPYRPETSGISITGGNISGNTTITGIGTFSKSGVELENCDIIGSPQIIGKVDYSESGSIGVKIKNCTIDGIPVTSENYGNYFEGTAVCKISINDTCVSK